MAATLHYTTVHCLNCSTLQLQIQIQLELRYITQHYTIYTNPPTPAFAKAGAAPGTTAGVELRSGTLATGICCFDQSVFLHCLQSPLLLGRSSLPFASQKNPKTPKMLQIHRGCLHQALRPQDHRRCGTSIRHSGHRHLLLRSKHCSLPFASIASIALCCSGIQACRLPAVKPLKPLKPLKRSKSLAAACTKHSGHKTTAGVELRSGTLATGICCFDQSVAACRLPPLPPKPSVVRAFKPAVCQP